MTNISKLDLVTQYQQRAAAEYHGGGFINIDSLGSRTVHLSDGSEYFFEGDWQADEILSEAQVVVDDLNVGMSDNVDPLRVEDYILAQAQNW